MDTNSWRIGAAKQQFSEVVRRSATEPQRIYNRDLLVAAVVSPELLDEAETRQRRQLDRSLADIFTELRTICADEDWELPVGARTNREGWPTATNDRSGEPDEHPNADRA